MKNGKIIIIGGGVAGLSAGIYGQLSGFDTAIYEKNPVPGGQCTGWDRDGCHIDGCIDWLTGSKKGTELNDCWREVGALGDDIELIALESYQSFDINGKRLVFWSDIDRAEREFIQFFPEDEAPLHELFNITRNLFDMDMPCAKPYEFMNPAELAAMGFKYKKQLWTMGRYSSVSLGKFAQKFKSPELRELFGVVFPKDFLLTNFLFGYATFACGNGLMPRGGSRAFALRMAEKYKSLCGSLNLGAPVKSIIIKNGAAAGITLESGEEVAADEVIAACDVKFTLDRLLGGKYHDKQFDMRFANPELYALPTSAMAAYRAEADMSHLPCKLGFRTEKPLVIGAAEVNMIGIKHYSFEPDFAPKGQTVFTVTFNQNSEDYKVWKALYTKDKAAYTAKKQALGDEIAARIEEHLPELSGRLHLIDFATPVTYERYENSYCGAWMAFMAGPGGKNMTHSGKLEGLSHFMLTGQWLTPPGGLPCALTNGKFTIQRLLKEKA